MGVKSLIYAFTSFLIFALRCSVIFNSFFVPPYFQSFCYSRHIFCDCSSRSDDPDDPKLSNISILKLSMWSSLFIVGTILSLSLSLQVILHQSVTFADGILILYFDMFYMQMYSKLKVYIRFSKIYESMWYHRSFLYPLKSSESFWL